jgi:hypothetical protein
MPSWFATLPDAPRNDMRGDSTLGGGGEDAGELRREERGDDDDERTEVGEGGDGGELEYS